MEEFAIHKGHKYATCVMDLDSGEIIWIGKGRATNDFEKFFQEYDMEQLIEVKAVAMDMNASYNNLVERYMPNANIVYDRYHMQAQFGKDVLGSVRLEEAREHKAKDTELKLLIKDGKERSKDENRTIKSSIANESQLYTQI